MHFKSTILSLFTAVLFSTSFSSLAAPENYLIDTEGGHASINFRTNHLGASWLTGRFDEFSGSFTFDEQNAKNNTITVDINVDSINSNHTKRDAHLKSDEMLDTAKHPDAKFVSTSISPDGDGYLVIGNFTLNGVTKEIRFHAKQTGAKNAMGKFRRGFEAETELVFSDYGYTNGIWNHLAKSVFITLYLEGIRQ